MKSVIPRTSSSLAVALALSLALGACGCSRSQDLLAPGAGAKRTWSGSRDIPVTCPNMIPNTPATPVEFVAISGLVASYTSRRIRFEMFGDLPSPTIENMGPCAATENPTIRFTSGHANVFIHGTTQSVTETGQPLTFGELLFPGALLEKGVIVTNDAVGNVLEIIWPTLAGTGIGAPIVRVQLARWNLNLVTTSQTYDVAWDMVVERDGVKMYIKGHADRLNLGGSPVAQAGASAPGPCPQTLAATSDTVITQLASIVQFRAGRLRLEVIGDVPTGTMEATGACAAATPGTIMYTGGSANMFRAGTNSSVTSTGGTLTFGALVFPGVTLEPGVVVAQDAAQNVLEIIWPALAGLGQGPPILRLQLASWNSWVITGQKVDATMRFDALGPDGITASYLALAKDVEIPVMK